MKQLFKSWLALIAGLVIVPACWSQPATTATAVATTTTTGAAPTNNLWSYLCMTPEQRLACKTCFCNSPIGQMVTGAAGPMSLASGGLLGKCCFNTSIANDLLKPADSSEGAAALVMKDEEGAKARRKAVRYLGTVDCSRWPEAEEALVNSLRGDRNECVRLEAALALRNGCCCTTKIRRALEATIMGKADKFPAERSERVKGAAADALAHCPAEEQIFEGPIPEIDKIKKASAQLQAAGYAHGISTPEPQAMPNSRGILVLMQQRFNVQQANATMPSANPAPYQRTGTLSGIMTAAFSAPPEPVVPTRPMQPVQAKVPAVPMAPQAIPIDWRPASQLPSGPSTPAMLTPVTTQPRQASGWVTIETAPVSIPMPPTLGVPGTVSMP